MTLMTIRLELGRSHDQPQGDSRHGYEFIAPLDSHGHLDADHWDRDRPHCGVRMFRPDRADRHGMLRRLGHGWRFDYDPRASEDDEPIFRLDRHTLAPGHYVSITEEDGVQRPFRVVSVSPVAA